MGKADDKVHVFEMEFNGDAEWLVLPYETGDMDMWDIALSRALLHGALHGLRLSCLKYAGTGICELRQKEPDD